MTTTEQGAQPAPQGVPDGWKLVPETISEEMHIAASKVLRRCNGLDGTPQRMLDAMLAAAPAAPQAEPQQPAQAEWRDVETVADMVHNLLTLDQSLPIYGAQYIQHEGRRRAIAVDATISRERVKDGRWIGEGDDLNTIIVWTRAAQPAGEYPAPFGDVNTQTGQFFTDVEQSRKNNEGHWRTVYVEADRAARAAPAQVGTDKLIELDGIQEAIDAGGGFWRSCSGCHELNEGHSTGPYSKVLHCPLGNGCNECGGIGAIWDTTDYAAMGDAMAAQEGQEAEPYAYEFGKDNGDGTFSVVIERGHLIEKAARSWAYGPPKNPHPEHPVKPLYTHPPRTQGDADKRDAERWKFLSDQNDWHSEQAGPDCDPMGSRRKVTFYSPADYTVDLNEAIDAAIARQGGKDGAA